MLHGVLKLDVALFKIIVEPFDSDEGPDAGEELDLYDRLDLEIIGARFNTLDLVFEFLEGSDHDVGDELRRFVALELLTYLISIHPRHPDIEKHNVRRGRFDIFDGFDPVVSWPDILSLRHQIGFEQFYILGMVVYYEEAGRSNG